MTHEWEMGRWNELEKEEENDESDNDSNLMSAADDDVVRGNCTEADSIERSYASDCCMDDSIAGDCIGAIAIAVGTCCVISSLPFALCGSRIRRSNCLKRSNVI